jgi:hypothetical protein
MGLAVRMKILARAFYRKMQLQVTSKVVSTFSLFAFGYCPLIGLTVSFGARLRSLETTGRSKYTIIVKVDIRGGATQLVLYSNPVTDSQLSYQAINLVKGHTHLVYSIA